MRIQFDHKFEDIISVENLLVAWQEFVRGKRNKPDVQLFASDLIDNILQLHEDLAKKRYQHGGYYQFNISDPKPRRISKASVRDRLVHHAVYRILYPFFDKTFIYDSYSCRLDKGTHKAIRRFRSMFLEVSNYNRRTCFVLKLDIKQFFASIDHGVLISTLKEYILDNDILWLLQEIILSFRTPIRNPESKNWILNPACLRQRSSAGRQVQDDKELGLPLGNLTSQLLVNVYMNEFDQFVKDRLKIKYYIRYADDFVILSPDKQALTLILSCIRVFLEQRLRLSLHPNKIILKTFSSGIDFLGWVNFPSHRVLRTATKRRMYHRLIRANMPMQGWRSYLGLLSHGDTYKLKQELLNSYYLFCQ